MLYYRHILCSYLGGDTMRLDQLHYFEVLVQERSFRKAAEQLHITQPSLTASIKALEKELDTQLLLRNTHGISLTEEGKKVLLFAKEVLGSYQMLWSSIHPEHSTLTGTMTVTAPKFFCELALEQFLGHFRTKYPQTKVRLFQEEYHTTLNQGLVAGGSISITSRMSAEQDDFCTDGMLVLDEEFFDTQYEYIPLFTDTVGICIAKSSSLSEVTNLYPCDIDHNQHPATVFPVRLTVIADEVLLASNNPLLHVDAILRDDAYCLLPYFVYRHYFSQERAIVFRPFDNNITITWYLLHQKDTSLTVLEETFIDELQHFLTHMKFK